MFKPLGLLAKVPCPDLADGRCQTIRATCPFSHTPLPATSTNGSSSSSVQLTSKAKPGERAISPSKSTAGTGTGVSTTATKRTVPATGHASSAVAASPPAKKARNAYTAGSKAVGTSSTASATITTTKASQVNAASSSRPGQTSASAAASKAASDGWSTVPIQPPSISFKQHPSSSQIALSSRQGTLKTLHAAYTHAYTPFLTSDSSVVRSAGQRLAHDHALAQELQIFKTASKVTYKSSSVTTLVGLKKLDAAVIEDFARRAVQKAKELEGAEAGEAERAVMAILLACPETGTALEARTKRQQAVDTERGKLTKDRLVNAGFVCPKGDLERHGFTAEIPESWAEEGGTKPDSIGEIKECTRCGKDFCVGGEMNEGGTERIPQDPHACRYHHGRKRFTRSEGSKGKVQTWLCCQRPVGGSGVGDDGCCLGPHVFKEESADDLNRREAFITSGELAASLKDDGATHDPLDIVALDCELSFTAAGMSLTRVTLISEDGSVILDELVRTRAEIIDYNTRFSGIQADEYERSAVLDLASARRAMGRFVGPSTILVGHGLENDLRALRLVHTTVVDTALLFQHPRGPPFRMALRDLTSKHLGKIIQAAGAHVGHSSAEDAQMALELVRWKIVNDPFSPFAVAAAGGGGGGGGGATAGGGDGEGGQSGSTGAAARPKEVVKGVSV